MLSFRSKRPHKKPYHINIGSNQDYLLFCLLKTFSTGKKVTMNKLLKVVTIELTSYAMLTMKKRNLWRENRKIQEDTGYSAYHCECIFMYLMFASMRYFCEISGPKYISTDFWSYVKEVSSEKLYVINDGLVCITRVTVNWLFCNHTRVVQKVQPKWIEETKQFTLILQDMKLVRSWRGFVSWNLRIMG